MLGLGIFSKTGHTARADQHTPSVSDFMQCHVQMHIHVPQYKAKTVIVITHAYMLQAKNDTSAKRRHNWSYDTALSKPGQQYIAPSI